MNDNEIIKALECCMFITPNKKCNECPKDNEGVECSVELHRHALDLINRQKAEIERLTKENSFVEAQIKEFVSMAGECRANAIKEFAERVKEELRLYTENNGGFVPSMIDNLVKEMVGE